MEKFEALVKIPFDIFVQIAETGSQISVKEANTFQEMLGNENWCKSNSLRSALPRTREGYSQFWKDHVKSKSSEEFKGNVINDIQSLLGSLTEVESTLLIQDLLFLSKRIASASKSSLFGSLTTPSLEAYEEFKVNLQSLPAIDDAKKSSGISQKGLVENSLNGSLDDQQIPRSKEQPSLQTDSTPIAPKIFSETATDTWTRGKIELRVVNIVQETHDVKTFVFRGSSPVLFGYKPGQFITLELEIDSKRILRSYTISSSPSRPHAISITVKRVPGGLVSNWLHDHLKIGDSLKGRGPNGKFTCLTSPLRKILFLAGGSGITPCMSMSRWLHDLNADCDVVFLYSARAASDLIFQKELELMTVQRSNFRYLVTCTRPSPGEGWMGYTGRVSEKLLELGCPDFLKRSVYCCGPEEFMDSVKTLFDELGFPLQNYHEESFGGSKGKTKEDSRKTSSADRKSDRVKSVGESGSPTILNPDQKPQEDTKATTKTASRKEFDHTILFKSSSRAIKCGADDYILDVAEEEGVEIDFSCRSGSCGTCKVKMQSGKVESESTDGLSDDDQEAGFILTCCSRPLSDLVFD